MKRLTFIIFFISSLGYSQTNELYQLAFGKSENFRILTTFKDKIPTTFSIIDTTDTWNPETFFLRDLNVRNPKVIDSIERDEHHPYFNSYLFSNEKLDSLIPDVEKERLFNLASKVTSRKVAITGQKLQLVRRFNKPLGFYFLVTAPLYATDNKHAFLAIFVKKKEVFLGEKMDNYFATLTLMFEKNKEQRWTQIGIKENLIL
ncbi:MAG TPA: hypothetical protein VF691_17295 [Cytophagaceae bacterium]|jgi:hypothetical protein